MSTKTAAAFTVLLTLLEVEASKEMRTCTTRVCSAVSDALRASISSSMNPCEDFYSYVCLGWLRRHEKFFSNKSARVGTVYRVVDSIHIILKKHLNKLARTYNNVSVLKTLRESEIQTVRFYSSCVQAYSSKSSQSSLHTLRKLFHSVNLEFFDETPNPNISAFSILLDLTVHYGISPLFSISYKSSTIAFRRTYIPSIFETDVRVTENLAEHWKPVLLEYARNGSRDSQIENMLGSVFEALLIRVKHDRLLRMGRNYFAIEYALRDLFVTWQLNQEFTFAEWANKTTIPWSRILNDHFGNLATILDREHTLLVDKEFYEGMANISSDPETVQIFKDFVAVYLLMSHFGKTMSSTAYRTICAYGECSPRDIDVEDRCVALAYKDLKWSSVAIISRLTQTQYTGKNIRYFFSLLKCMSLKVLQPLFAKQIKAMKFVLTQMSTLRDQSFYPAYFDRFDIIEHRTKISPTDFLSNTIAVMRSKQAKRLSRFGLPFDRNSNLNAIPTFLYLTYYDDIYLPGNLMLYPHFVESLPHWMNIGSLGFLVGHEIGHALDKYIAAVPYAIVDGQDKRQVYKSEKYRTARKCFANQFKVPNATNGWLFVSEALADCIGFKLSLEAFKRLRKMGFNNGRLENIHGLNQQQLFFVSTATLFCIASTSISMNPSEKHAPPHYRINRGLSNFADFSKVFGCKPSDAMVANPSCTT